MASTTIKGTYSLDPATIRILNQVARRWGVSKSEALRRAIRGAAADPSAAAQASGVLKALDRLQGTMAMNSRKAGRWATEVRAERRASKRGKTQPR